MRTSTTRVLALAGGAIGCAALTALIIATLTPGEHVRADAPPGQLTSLGDGTVRDNETGLTWRAGFSPTTMSHADAIAYCDDMGDSWRLPTVLELRSIVDESRVDPAIDTTFFPSTPAERFWSITTKAGSTDIWWVDFADGSAIPSLIRDETYYARCVR